MTLNSICARLLLSLLCACVAVPLAAQSSSEKPEKTTVCELLAHRDQWDHKLVQVGGVASVGFERATFGDPDCLHLNGLWMQYGRRPADITTDNTAAIQGITVDLVDDVLFHRFDDALRDRRHPLRGGTVRAIVVARFFATSPNKRSGQQTGGFGHLGCCSLFVIQQVLDVDDLHNPNLDYGDFPDQPLFPAFQSLAAASTRAAQLRDQKNADEGERAYAFTDDQRVARETIASYASPPVDPGSLALTKKSGNAYRVVYTAKTSGSNRHFMVVLSRPYTLANTARELGRVPWVVLAAYELQYDDSK